MNEKKEVKRVQIANFIGMYVLMVPLIWLLLCIKYDWSLVNVDYTAIFINPLVMSFGFVIGSNSKRSYETRVIENSTENITKLDQYTSAKGVSFDQNIGSAIIYKVKNKSSLIQMKFSITKSQDLIELRIPKVVWLDMNKRVALLSDVG